MRYLFFLLIITASVSAQDRAFDQAVAPLLIERCIDCHSGSKPKGKLDLTRKASTAKVMTPKKLDDSVLWQRVVSGEMPPKKPLSEKEKSILKAWIERGGEWGVDPIDPFRVTTSSRAGYDWWALRPIQRPDLPVVKAKDWPTNAIDRFILAKLEAEGLTPSPAADNRTLVRRLYYDVIGLPPDPKGSLLSPMGLVDELLASPHYGERWARHWLDVVRFGESHGFEHDELRKNAWPYRDWVIDAFNKDMPYDEFARMQIAGDVLKPGDGAAITATGFLVAGGYDSVGQGQQSAAMKAVVRQDELEDIVGTLGQTFLGLTVQCARCHDHKFDPVRIDEYYRLTAAVAGVRHGERDISAKQPIDKSQAEQQKRFEQLRAELAKLDAPIRTQILAERKKVGKGATSSPGNAVARWDFTKSAKDEVGGIEAKLHGDATLSSDGLVLAGMGYASTPPIGKPIHAKTLLATVRLANVTQRGGAAISLQSPDGLAFDAIVLGERELGRWMSGSEFFKRTQNFQGANETDTKPVHIAITYHADGSIIAYRNGVQYGSRYRVKSQLTFDAGKAMLLFGLRHTPAGANKHLVGTLIRAELFDRALLPDEVAASAGVASDFVGDDEIVKRLEPAERTARAGLLKRLADLATKNPVPASAMRVYAVNPRAVEPTYLLHRGVASQRGPVVTPGGVAALKLNADFGLDEKAPDADRRRKLAEWITDTKNPLFARVMVNRLWQYHFGVGIVETSSDFGFNGARPTHPELLDWLASEFIANGYSIKHIHRLILNSATYRQASAFRPEAAKRDAGNRWLWRKFPTRLEAEALRDSILSVAGQLNMKQGGPGYQDFKVTVRGATHYYTPVEDDNPALYRRSIYRTAARSGRNGLLDAHDCPDPSTTSPRRALTTTPLQALSLMNNAFVLRMADRFAERVTNEAGAEVSKQVSLVFGLAYGRTPSAEELANVRPVIERHGLAVFCRAVFNSNEFVYVD